MKATSAWSFILKNLLSLLILLSNSFALNAQERGSTASATNNTTISGNTYAVILGISDYPNLPPLQYADKDALLFKEFLQSDAGGKVPEDNIKTLINEEATSVNFWIKDGYRWLMGKSPKKGDRVYFYFAGHGDAINKSEYFFLTYDCQPGNDKNNYLLTGNIQLYNLKSRIQDLTNEGVEVLLIMDACRTGDLPGGVSGQQFFSESIVEKKAGELILLASGPNQFSYEDKDFGGGHGLFTYYLVDGLSGTADEDGDQKVSYVELQDYVKKKVRVSSSNKYKKPQIPSFCCSEKDMDILSTKDDKLQASIQTLGKIGEIYASNLNVESNKRGVDGFADTSQYYLYRKLLKTIKEEDFVGEVGSISVLKEMFTNCLECEVTQAAKRELAVAFLNYGQAKINLHLAGKDNKLNLKSLKISSNASDKKSAPLINEEYNRLEKLQETSFKYAAEYLEGALYLLDNDSFYTSMYQNKIDFLNLYSDVLSETDKTNWIKRLNSLLQKDSSAYNLNLAGTIYYDLNDFNHAISYYKKAIAVAPQWAYPKINIGKAYLFGNNDNLLAKQFINEALQIDSNSIISLQLMGIIETNLKNYSAAKQWLNKGIATSETPVNLYLSLSNLYIDQQNYDSAKATLRHAATIQQNDARIYRNLAGIYNIEKQTDSAEMLYLTAFITDTNDVTNYNDLGTFYMNKKNYDKAKTYFLNGIEKDSTFIYAYRNLSSIYVIEKDYKQAQDWCNKALTLKIDSTTIYNDLGLIATEMKDFKQAEKWFLKAINIDKTNKYAYNNLNNNYITNGQYQQANDWLLKENKSQPNNMVVYNSLCFLNLKKKQYDSMFYWASKANAIDSLDMYNCFYTAFYYTTKNDYKTALKNYKRIKYRGYTDRDVYFTLYDMAKQNKNWQQCLKYSYEMLPMKFIGIDSASLLSNIGWAYFVLNQQDSAVYYFKEGMKVNSKDYYSSTNLLLLYLSEDKVDDAVTVMPNMMASPIADSTLIQFLVYDIYVKTNQIDKAKETLDWLINKTNQEPKTSAEELALYLASLYKNPGDQQSLTKLITLIKSDKLSYFEVKSYYPLLKNNSIYSLSGVAESIKKTYPYW